jgi:spore cortex formation protein SpoVR/YcgB (stage V sporulation)
MMHILVIIHAWMGHVHLFTNNEWHKETDRVTALQKLAQDAAFVDALVNDPKYVDASRGLMSAWEKYEYYADAAHALEHHSGELPTNRDAVPDELLREQLKQRLEDLKSAYTLARTDQDRAVVESDLRDTVKLLSCHPIYPTADLLGFLMDPANTKHLTDKERRIIEMTRWENRYSTQVIGRTKIMHEGFSHFMDRYMPMEPELDLIRLGFEHVMNAAKYDTMHDAWPIYRYSDPYAFGLEVWEYLDATHSRKIGKETIRFNRLKMLTEEDVASGKYPTQVHEDKDAQWTYTPKAGDIVETDEVVEREVDKWDRSYMLEVAKTYDDTRFFYTFLTEDFFERLHSKTLGWVKKMIMVINKTLKDVRWDPALIFEGARFPQTLEEMYQVISLWMNQLQTSQWVGQYFGYGAPPFPVSQVTLYQMLQIIQTVASYDADKDEFKRQMLLRTSLFALPNIKNVDTGRENKEGRWTLRHEYDPDFGPLKQGHARETLRFHWRFSGPVRLLTMEILTDSYGRPWGPPRPYQYFTDNGKTVKERWL